MRHFPFPTGIALLFLFFVTTIATTSSEAGDSYNKILAAAKQEGKVVVSGPNYDPDDVKVLNREVNRDFAFPFR